MRSSASRFEGLSFWTKITKPLNLNFIILFITLSHLLIFIYLTTACLKKYPEPPTSKISLPTKGGGVGGQALSVDWVGVSSKNVTWVKY